MTAVAAAAAAAVVIDGEKVMEVVLLVALVDTADEFVAIGVALSWSEYFHERLDC